MPQRRRAGNIPSAHHYDHPRHQPAETSSSHRLQSPRQAVFRPAESRQPFDTDSFDSDGYQPDLFPIDASNADQLWQLETIDPTSLSLSSGHSPVFQNGSEAASPQWSSREPALRPGLVSLLNAEVLRSLESRPRHITDVGPHGYEPQLERNTSQGSGSGPMILGPPAIYAQNVYNFGQRTSTAPFSCHSPFGSDQSHQQRFRSAPNEQPFMAAPSGFPSAYTDAPMTSSSSYTSQDSFPYTMNRGLHGLDAIAESPWPSYSTSLPTSVPTSGFLSSNDSTQLSYQQGSQDTTTSSTSQVYFGSSPINISTTNQHGQRVPIAHSPTSTVSPTGSSPPANYCHTCLKSFSRASDFRRHNDTVHGPWIWVCLYCKKRNIRDDKVREFCKKRHPNIWHGMDMVLKTSV